MAKRLIAMCMVLVMLFGLGVQTLAETQNDSEPQVTVNVSDANEVTADKSAEETSKNTSEGEQNDSPEENESSTNDAEATGEPPSSPDSITNEDEIEDETDDVSTETPDYDVDAVNDFIDRFFTREDESYPWDTEYSDEELQDAYREYLSVMEDEDGQQGAEDLIIHLIYTEVNDNNREQIASAADSYELLEDADRDAVNAILREAYEQKIRLYSDEVLSGSATEEDIQRMIEDSADDCPTVESLIEAAQLIEFIGNILEEDSEENETAAVNADVDPNSIEDYSARRFLSAFFIRGYDGTGDVGYRYLTIDEMPPYLISTIDDDTYTALLYAVRFWNAMSDKNRKVVNDFLTEQRSTTFEKLARGAYSYACQYHDGLMRFPVYTLCEDGSFVIKGYTYEEAESPTFVSEFMFAPQTSASPRTGMRLMSYSGGSNFSTDIGAFGYGVSQSSGAAYNYSADAGNTIGQIGSGSSHALQVNDPISGLMTFTLVPSRSFTLSGSPAYCARPAGSFPDGQTIYADEGIKWYNRLSGGVQKALVKALAASNHLRYGWGWPNSDSISLGTQVIVWGLVGGHISTNGSTSGSWSTGNILDNVSAYSNASNWRYAANYIRDFLYYYGVKPSFSYDTSTAANSNASQATYNAATDTYTYTWTDTGVAGDNDNKTWYDSSKTMLANYCDFEAVDSSGNTISGVTFTKTNTTVTATIPASVMSSQNGLVTIRIAIDTSRKITSSNTEISFGWNNTGTSSNGYNNANQPVVTLWGYSGDDMYSYVSVKGASYGKISILKSSTDSSVTDLSGAVFYLYKNYNSSTKAYSDYLGYFRTNSAGQGLWNGASGVYTTGDLALGTYYLKEVTALPSHSLRTTPVTITLSTAGKTVTQTISNTAQYGKIKLVKTSDDPYITSKANAVFWLWKNYNSSNGTYSDYKGRFTTNADGVGVWDSYTENNGALVSQDLLLGTYYLQEITPLSNHNALTSPITVNLTTSGATVTVTAPNTVKKGYVALVKSSSSSAVTDLSGASFNLWSGCTNNGGSYSYTGYLGSFTTDSSGRGLWNNQAGVYKSDALPIGHTYYLQEVTPLPNHDPITDPISVSLLTNDTTVTKYVTNTIHGSITINKVSSAQTNLKLSGAEFSLYRYTNMSTPIASGTTDSNGQLTFSGLDVDTTYVIVETKGPPYYKIDTAQTTVTITGLEPNKSVTITNTPYGWVSLLKNSTDADLTNKAGAVFGLYRYSDDALIETFVTVSSGLARSTSTGLYRSQDLPYGLYYFKELTPLAGHDQVSGKMYVDVGNSIAELANNTRVFPSDYHTINRDFASTAYSEYSSIYNTSTYPSGLLSSWKLVTVTNTRINNVSISKSVASGYADMVANNSCYDLAGTTFGIYANASDAANKTNALGTITINSDGTSSTLTLPSKTTYWYRELTAGKGYILDDTVRSFYLGTTDVTLQITNVPGNDPLGLTITKKGKTVAATDLPAAPTDVVFSIEWFSGHYTTEADARAAVTAGTAQHRTWYVHPVWNTYQSQYVAMLDYPNLNTTAPYASDSVFTDPTGIVVPHGTIVIREVSGGEYYLNDADFGNGSDHILFRIEDDGSYDGDAGTVEISPAVSDTIMPQIDTTLTDTAGESLLVPLHEVNLKDSVAITNLEDFIGKTIQMRSALYLVSIDGTSATKISGTDVTKNISITSNAYSLENTFTIDAWDIYGRTVVAYVELYYNGELISSHDDVSDTDQQVTFLEVGKASFYKHGEQLVDATLNADATRTFVYEDRGLSGPTFRVVTAEDIRSVDGTLVYANGATVTQYASIRPDANGYIRLEDLQYGNYKLVEISTDGTHALVEDTLFEVNATTGTSSTEVDHSILDIRGTMTINVVKTDGVTSSPLPGVKYGLFANEIIKSYDGTELVAENDIVAVGTTDSSGELTFSVDIPVGYTWYVQELDTPYGYQRSDTKNIVEFLSVTGTQSVFTATLTLTNTPIPGQLLVKKTDANNLPMKDVKYCLEYSTDNGSSWAPVYVHNNATGIVAGGCTSASLNNGSLVTDINGEAAFTGLIADGKTMYRLTETETADGHMLLAESVFLGTLPITEDDTFDITVYDVTGDGIFDVQDYYALRFYVNDNTSGITVSGGDVNGDGTISSADLTALQAKLASYSDVTSDTEKNVRYEVTFRITDTQVAMLPATGGNGFTPTLAIGIGMLYIPAAMLLISRKRKKKGFVKS